MSSDDSNLLIEEILSTSRALADLEQDGLNDGLDEPLHLRQELRERRRVLLDRLKAAKPEVPLVSEIEPPAPPKRRKSSRRVA
jgi:hypothetical protein